MDISPQTDADAEITADDLDTAIYGLQLVKDKIESEEPDPLTDHQEWYRSRRDRSDAVDAVIRKFRRERDELRRL